MLIVKIITLLVNEILPKDVKNLVNPQKGNQNFILNFEKSESKPKKHERFLEEEFFVLWAALDCKSSFPLTEP